MKRLTLIFVILTLSSYLFSQRHFGGKLEKDMFGTWKYERRDGFRASLSENIFNDLIYEDSNKNKLVYKKKFLDRLERKDKQIVFNDLLRYFRDKEDLQEEFEVDIFDKLIYRNNHRFQASLSENIFDDIEYEDSNRNKLVYKKKFLDLFQITELENLDPYLFMDMFYSMMSRKNYRAEYAIDIFDRISYTNSEGDKIEIDVEDARRMLKAKNKRRDFFWDDLF